VSHPAPRHRKQPQSTEHSTDEYFAEAHRHRKQSADRPSWKSGRLAAIAGTVMVLGAAAAATAVYLPGSTGHPAASTTTIGGKPVVADGLGRTVANGVGLAIGAMPRASTSSQAKPTASAHSTSNSHAAKSHASSSHASKPAARAAAVTKPTAQPKLTDTVYQNPLRSIKGLMAERIDMGADYGGSGPIYALGNAVITNATGNSTGWPGGGWITYQLTDGPAKGLVVYVAEDVTPSVQVGQHVTSSTVICNMFNGSAGIETGWATSDSSTAESQMPAAGGISGGGPFPTAVGMNFENLLVALGVPRSPFNGSASPFGVVPSGYPTSWSSVLTTKS